MTDKSSEPLLHPLIATLTLAGALPFLGAAIAAWRQWPLPFDPVYAGVVYAAIILSFLGGIQWSAFLKTPTPKTWVIVMSNVLALLGWVCVLSFAMSPSGIAIFLALGFLMALFIDRHLYQQDFLPKHFYRLRQLITAIVVFCLIVMGVAQHFALIAH